MKLTEMLVPLFGLFSKRCMRMALVICLRTFCDFFVAFYDIIDAFSSREEMAIAIANGVTDKTELSPEAVVNEARKKFFECRS